jgi:hypothetical protein
VALPSEPEWLPTEKALRLAGFNNRVTFLKVVRARKIEARRGRRNQKLYSRGKMMELRRDRDAAEKRRSPRQDPLSDPLRSGDIHAAALELLDNGASPVDVVKQLKIPVELAEDLFTMWVRLNRMNAEVRNPQQATAPTVLAATSMPLAMPPGMPPGMPIEAPAQREHVRDGDLDALEEALKT